VTRESGTFDEFYATDKHKALAADWLEITLTDASLVANPMGLLRTKFPHLLSVRQGSLASESEGERRLMDAAQASKRDPVTDFSDFETDLYGTCDESKRSLFAELLAEVEREA
jgi:exonuclease SbcD